MHDINSMSCSYRAHIEPRLVDACPRLAPCHPVSWNGVMESTAGDAMPDDTDLTPQDPDTELSRAENAAEQ